MIVMDYLFSKILLLGLPGEGKENLTKKYCSSFNSLTKQIIGVDFYFQDIEINDTKVRFCIWDLAEEERFRKINSCYYIGASAGLLIFDLNKAAKIDQVHKWIRFVQ